MNVTGIQMNIMLIVLFLVLVVTEHAATLDLLTSI